MKNEQKEIKNNLKGEKVLVGVHWINVNIVSIVIIKE